jgi:crotonobetainyl-CoA:carnitine CoA-transferase CaiB-like acyl-CoA transferase
MFGWKVAVPRRSVRRVHASDRRLDGRGRYALLEEVNASWAIRRLSRAFATRPAEEWLRRLDAVGCPASAVGSREAWLDHPQVRAIGMRIEVKDTDRGVVAMPGIPVDLPLTPGRVRAGALSRHHGATMPEWRAPPDDPSVPDPGSTGSGPLRGIRVADLATVLTGPFAGSLLAELGADVVKVEPPGGESFRGAGFAPYNKGQRSLVLDLRHEQGRRAFLDLAGTCDVVIDNYRSGVASRLGLDYAALSRINPGVTTVSISGFDEGGPLGALPDGVSAGDALDEPPPPRPVSTRSSGRGPGPLTLTDGSYRTAALMFGRRPGL